MKRRLYLLAAGLFFLVLLVVIYIGYGLNSYVLIALLTIPVSIFLWRSYFRIDSPDSRNTYITNLLTGLTVLVGIMTYQVSNDDARDQEKAANLVESMKIYMNVQNERRAALTETDTAKRRVMARNYWRNLFDMHWLVFQLYRKSDMDQNIFTTWTTSRFINYWSAGESIPVGDGSSVSYRQEWEQLGQGHYFMDKGEYQVFMKEVYQLFDGQGARYVQQPDRVWAEVHDLLVDYDRRERLHSLTDWFGFSDDY